MLAHEPRTSWHIARISVYLAREPAFPSDLRASASVGKAARLNAWSVVAQAQLYPSSNATVDVRSGGGTHPIP